MLAGQRRPACCSPSRPRRTCTPSPATPCAIGRAGGPPAPACGSTASSTCPRPTRCSSRSARRSARSRRRRRTTSSCCRSAAFDRAMRGVPVTTQVHARSRTALPGQPERRLHAGLRRARATSRPGSPAPGSSATTSARRSTRRARTRSTPSCCSCSSASRARSSPALRHRVDRLRRRRPPPPRRRAAAHARRLDAASSCGSRSRETALAGGRRRRGRPRRARSLIGAAAFGTASFGAGTLRRPCCGRAARRSPASRSPRRAIALPAWRDARALTVAGQRRQRRPRATARRGGRATGSTSSRSPARRSSTGRRRATATSSCSRPRACRRSRSTGTRCWRRCSAGSAPACSPTGSPTSCSRADAGRSARALRPVAGELSPTVAATMAASGGCWRGAVALVALDRRVRRLDRRLQLDLPAAGRGRRAADQRRRRDRHRVARRERRPAARPRGSPRVPGVQQRRAAAAPLRLRRRRPAGPLRRAPGDDRRGRQAPGRLVPGRQRQAADGPARRAARLVLVAAETVQGLPAPARRPAPPAPAGRRAPSSSTPCRSTTPASPRSSRPRRRDSFLVANAAYVAQGDRQRRGRHVPGPDRRHEPGRGGRAGARRRSARRRRSPTSQHQRRVVGSNLTAVELSGLTKVELGFALVLAVAASGLALGLGFQERRRTFAIAARSAPGARQLGGFVWGESAVRHRPAAWCSAPRRRRASREMLVKVLTGVFDPPPDALAVPWGYLGGRGRAHRRRRSPPPARRRCARCAGRRSRS